MVHLREDETEKVTAMDIASCPTMVGLWHDVDRSLQKRGAKRRVRREIRKIFEKINEPHIVLSQAERLLQHEHAPPRWLRRVKSLVDDFMKERHDARFLSFVPELNIAEGEDEILITVALPGLSLERLTVDVDSGNVLTIAGEKDTESSRRCEDVDRVERSFVRISRSLSLPEDVDPRLITAAYRKGVLTVVLKRVHGDARPASPPETGEHISIPVARGRAHDRVA